MLNYNIVLPVPLVTVNNNNNNNNNNNINIKVLVRNLIFFLKKIVIVKFIISSVLSSFIYVNLWNSLDKDLKLQRLSKL